MWKSELEPPDNPPFRDITKLSNKLVDILLWDELSEDGSMMMSCVGSRRDRVSHRRTRKGVKLDFKMFDCIEPVDVLNRHARRGLVYMSMCVHAYLCRSAYSCR